MKKVTPNSDEKVLENFMKEFFPFNEFKKAGIFTKEMKGDYKAQSEKIRIFFGYDSIYEYGAETIHCHITFSGLATGRGTRLAPNPCYTLGGVIPQMLN